MYQKKLIILFLGFFFLTGCASLFPTNSGENEENEQVIGTKGLTIKFEENLPPEIASEGSQITISFLIKNEGTYNLEEKADGSPEEYFLKVSSDTNSKIIIDDERKTTHRQTLNESLIGINQYRTQGGFTTQEFQGEIDSSSTQLKKTTRITGTLCFPYKTQLKTTTCLDDSLINFNEEKICEAGETLFESQGAPVAITKIQEQKLQKKRDGTHYNLKIYLENVGEGVIIKENKTREQCFQGLPFTPDEINLGLKTISAKPQNQTTEYKYSYKENNYHDDEDTCNRALNNEENDVKEGKTCKLVEKITRILKQVQQQEERNAPIVRISQSDDELECDSLRREGTENYIKCGINLGDAENIINSQTELTIIIPYGYQITTTRNIEIT